ncbi:DUF7379 domain-containing protein [Caballeronia sordidicola]|uniref:DUF7379 domain-containing protein n=1 Tax=Caballeronia sordidicola TaxID=196367 RepID=UPI0004D009E6|nr:CHAT domain-containing protein [Caballeronia sordidicola]
MARESFSAGLNLEFDDQHFALSSSERTSRSRRGGAFGPAVVIVSSGEDVGVAEAVMEILRTENVVERASDAIELTPIADRLTRKGSSAMPTRLTVEVEEEQQAVVLVESDGLLWWEFGQANQAPEDTARRRGEPVSRSVTFSLDAPPLPSHKRGVLRQMIPGAIRAIVLYFAAEKTADALVAFIDGKHREGPVRIGSATDVAAWVGHDDYAGMVQRRNPTGKFLLLLHGTFSTTVGGFGELAATPWGQRFLAAADARYDAVIGFDHHTVGTAPDANAARLAAALKTLPCDQPIELDVVCHSRAGLVLRSLAEQLRRDGSPIKIKRAIFVGATHLGTQLARPENWESLVNLITNLSSVATRVLALFPGAATASAVARETIKCIGQFVKYLAQVSIAERRLPGIAAMDPDGEFVETINIASNVASLSDTESYVITSNFNVRILGDGSHEPGEFPSRLAYALADVAVDRLMKGDQSEAVPNDLVVDVASILGKDSTFGAGVKDLLNFGSNPLVYHTNYFLRPETVARLALWLHLPSPVEDLDLYRLAGAKRGILPMPAETTVGQALQLVSRVKPDYVVVARKNPYRQTYIGNRRTLHYAISADELRRSTQNSETLAPLEQALGLHESDISQECEIGQAPLDIPDVHATMPSASRTVVTGDWGAQAVLEPGSRAANALVLAEMASQIHAQADALAQDDADYRVIDESEREKVATLTAAAGADGSYLELPPLLRSLRAATKIESPVEVRRTIRKDPLVKRTPTRKEPGKSGGERPAARPKPRETLAPLHATAQMRSEVALGSTTTLTVTLSAEDIAIAHQSGEARDKQDAMVDPREQLTIHAIPRCGFDYVPGERDRIVVDYPVAGRPQIVDFIFKANEAGEGEISVAVRQNNVRHITLTLRCAIVPQADRAPRSVFRTAVAPDTDDSGCPSLEVFDRRNGQELRYEFLLDTDRVHDRFQSDPIMVDPKEFISGKYEAIDEAWAQTQGQVDQFSDWLEAFGGQMFKELFPLTLQEQLWSLVRDDSLEGIQIHSDEPFLPWEVVFLDDPDEQGSSGKGLFLGELGLCRWLYGAKAARSITVRPDRAKYVIPNYPTSMKLRNAETAEKAMLVKYGFSPIKPRYKEVLEALKGPGAFDLLHFACHGASDSRNIDTASLLLEGSLKGDGNGRLAWYKESLDATVVDRFANFRSLDGNRPLVIVNACETGRLGYSLTKLGGFATAFLGPRLGTGDSRGRAGAFVGTLWSVDDKYASTFVEKLYAELSAGRTMAQASRAARQGAREAGDGTWLAYTVYAYPGLVVNFEAL